MPNDEKLLHVHMYQASIYQEPLFSFLSVLDEINDTREHPENFSLEYKLQLLKKTHTLFSAGEMNTDGEYLFFYRSYYSNDEIEQFYKFSRSVFLDFYYRSSVLSPDKNEKIKSQLKDILFVSLDFVIELQIRTKEPKWFTKFMNLNETLARINNS